MNKQFFLLAFLLCPFATLIISKLEAQTKNRVAVTGSATPVYMTRFTDCIPAGSPPEGFSAYSVKGAATWACSGFGIDSVHSARGSANFGLQMNGYDNTLKKNAENEDWLLSPPYDLSKTNYPFLSFWSRTSFSGSPIQVKISTDYSGSGNPALASWTDLNTILPATGSDTWSLSSPVNLAAFKHPGVYIAWVYHSSNEDGARWTLDNIGIYNSAFPPPPTISISTNQLHFLYTAPHRTATQSFTLQAANTGAGKISIRSAAPGFLVSTDNKHFTAALSLNGSKASAAPQAIYTQFTPVQGNRQFKGKLIIGLPGAANTAITLTGNSIDPATTLDIMNWNMEWFATPDQTLGPANKILQQENASIVLSHAGADLFALVEVVDTAALGNIVRTALPGYGYIICNYGSHGNPYETSPSPMNTLQKEAFVYRKSMFTNIDTSALLSLGVNTAADLNNPDYNYWSSGRYPFMMTADMTVTGITRRIHFVALHAKANTLPIATAYNRRKSGADDLHRYLNARFPNDDIMVLGDFNDDLDSTITEGISPRLSSYTAFTQDPGSFYSPTLADLSLSGQKSTVAYNDVIDHVLLSDELQPFYLSASAAVRTDLAAMVTNYGTTTSDHYPVFTRYNFASGGQDGHPAHLTAGRTGNTVQLRWRSAAENRTWGYWVQRSVNGTDYTTIGSVAARRKAAIYVVRDRHPAPGNSFYRLKTVYKDGKWAFSAPIRFRFKE